MVNRITLIGNVGQDPEVRVVGENKVANFNLATSESYKNKNGEKVTDTQRHRIVCWRFLAELAEKYITKGKRIFVEGKVVYRSYEKDGATVYITEIVASSITLLGSKGDKPAQSAAPKQERKDVDPFEDEKDVDPFEDDLPF